MLLDIIRPYSDSGQLKNEMDRSCPDLSGSERARRTLNQLHEVRYSVRPRQMAGLMFRRSRAAAIATGCEIKVKHGPAYFDLRQNSVLGGPPVCNFAFEWSCNVAFPLFFTHGHSTAQDFTDIVGSRYGLLTVSGEHSASTDFVSNIYDPYGALRADNIRSRRVTYRMVGPIRRYCL